MVWCGVAWRYVVWCRLVWRGVDPTFLSVTSFLMMSALANSTLAHSRRACEGGCEGRRVYACARVSGLLYVVVMVRACVRACARACARARACVCV